MKKNIAKFIKLRKIPKDDDMTDELFSLYDSLLQVEAPPTQEEAKVMITMFSDDCHDLNWALLHVIESVELSNTEEYENLIAQCNNAEFREILEIRFRNC